MAKVTLRALKQYLAARSEEELRDDILALFGRFDAVKDFYQVQLGGDDEEVRAKYRAIIEREFAPARGFPRLRLSVARKALSDYQKVSGSASGRIDLLLTYAEAGVRCLNTYGELPEGVYDSLDSVFRDATALIAEQGLQATYAERCQRIVRDARNVGYGLEDSFAANYAMAFGG